MNFVEKKEKETKDAREMDSPDTRSEYQKPCIAEEELFTSYSMNCKLGAACSTKTPIKSP
jgi:hypothetical protein